MASVLKGVWDVVRHDVGVTSIRCGRFALGINTAVHAFRVGDVLIDTCSPNQWHRMAATLQAQPPLKACVLTHHHEDHAGNAGSIQRMCTGSGTRAALPVYAPKLALAPLRDGFPIEYYRNLVWGRYTVRCEPTEMTQPVRATLEDGSHVSLHALHSPGHCDDHSVIWVPERGWLFSADLLVTSKPRMAFKQEVLADTLATLRDIVRLPVTTLWCSHRGRLDDGVSQLRARLDWMETLQQRAVELHETRGWPVARIARQLLGREDFLYYVSRGDFARRNLVVGLLQAAGVAHPRE